MRARWLRWAKNGLAIGALLLLFRILLPYISTNSTQPYFNIKEAPLAKIQEEIVDLSRGYVSKLAEEQTDLQDNPYRHVGTAYDLKKTLAVLLININDRLSRLESQVSALATNSSVKIKAIAAQDDLSAVREAQGLLTGRQEACPSLPEYSKEVWSSCEAKIEWMRAFWRSDPCYASYGVDGSMCSFRIYLSEEVWSSCEAKIEWMRAFWRSDPCYASYGVDGSMCSFRIYLSEVERHCPPLPWRPGPAAAVSVPPSASTNGDLDSLVRLFDNPSNLAWIHKRLERLWPHWVKALQGLKDKAHWLPKRRPLSILLHIGSLTKESGFKFGASADSGGPLGELVQWADLLAALHLLGHKLTISSEIPTFVHFAQADPALKSSCPVLDSAAHVDLIFTDIVGLRQMKRKIPGSLQNYKCRLRVLDSFGTEAEFNYGPYFTAHKQTIGGSKKNAWGGHGLRLPQFYTMFPHSPDNTFLGFVVETFPLISSTPPPRKDWALIYGKAAYMWEGSEELVRTLQDEGLEVHGTVGGDSPKLPSGVVNHGVLSGPALHQLLRQVKVFVGLGFPFEGPAPLEAIANGAVFLNPLFHPPRGRGTHKFFAEKPTLRKLSSQNPYAEVFIGQPHVLTMDIHNASALAGAVKQALGSRPDPHLPYELTFAGMLERLGVLLEHQDLCSSSGGENWPPFAAAKPMLGLSGFSCVAVCRSAGLVCEPAWWPKLNRKELLANRAETEGDGCKTHKAEGQPDAPGLASDGACIVNKERLLFSCASEARDGFRRLCPCRDYVKGQVALCAACL